MTILVLLGPVKVLRTGLASFRPVSEGAKNAILIRPLPYVDAGIIRNLQQKPVCGLIIIHVHVNMPARAVSL